MRTAGGTRHELLAAGGLAEQSARNYQEWTRQCVTRNERKRRGAQVTNSQEKETELTEDLDR